MTNNLFQLANQIDNHFNLSELRTLCFALEVDYEHLAGENKLDKIRELLLHLRRHGLFSELLPLLLSLRPSVIWLDIPTQIRSEEVDVPAANPNNSDPSSVSEIQTNTTPNITQDSPAAIDDFSFDVFISYHQKDKTWVRKVLVPPLEAAGFKIFIDYRNFRLGVPIVTEMARAVEQSRYTLAILTPAYLENGFSNLENVLAEHLGLEENQRKLLAVMREECAPRLGLRLSRWLDMTIDEEFPDNIERLIGELRLPM
ncbi:MAG TPA: TIR domain-containing protein [Cyclobacteriaceae bacterium]|nr:TIR domain-containing protein [Cyclobacteriaceae bacterium]